MREVHCSLLARPALDRVLSGSSTAVECSDGLLSDLEAAINIGRLENPALTPPQPVVGLTPRSFDHLFRLTSLGNDLVCTHLKLIMKTMLTPTLLCAAILAAPGLRAADDILIADFEGPDYGQWKTTGEAFGPGPAQGTLPDQMPVDGYQGKGLVNSFHKGDGTTGTLTSPEFKIERKFISFLIGGGKDTEKTCMNLLIDGKVVRNATGPNDKPGGSETLAPDVLGRERVRRQDRRHPDRGPGYRRLGPHQRGPNRPDRPQAA